MVVAPVVVTALVTAVALIAVALISLSSTFSVCYTAKRKIGDLEV